MGTVPFVRKKPKVIGENVEKSHIAFTSLIKRKCYLMMFLCFPIPLGEKIIKFKNFENVNEGILQFLCVAPLEGA